MNYIFDKLRAILTEQFSFHYDQLQLETKFELELGMDSRELLELFTSMEVLFEIEVNFDHVDSLIEEGKFTTIQDIVTYIENEQLWKLTNQN
jgi:acyl carrier protein